MAESDMRQPGDATQSAQSSGARMRDKMAESAGKARQQAEHAAEGAREAIDSRRGAAASTMERGADALKNRADSMPGGPRVRRAARATADRLESGARYVRDRDVRGMVGDLETFVRQRPGATLAIVAVLGFLLLAVVYALSLTMQPWLAAAIVGIVLGAVAAILASAARKRLRSVDMKPDRTIQSVKENVKWARDQTR